MEFMFCGKVITPQTLKEEKWLQHLFLTRENQINMERVNSVSELKDNQVLAYVERTLNAFSKTSTLEKEKYRRLVIRTLQWSEVAKAGTPKDREAWSKQGLSLGIHNEASAEIYLKESTDDMWTTRVVYNLIKTHGLIGQFIRGEINFYENAPLVELLSTKVISKEHLYTVLYDLNRAILMGVNEKLWNELEEQIKTYINIICSGKYVYLRERPLDRLRRLFPAFKQVDALTHEEEKLYEQIFAYHDLWYPQVALGSFSRKEINTVFQIISKADRRQVKHISFYNFSCCLAYDFEGKRKENVYKKRIIELALREYAEGIEDPKSKEHVSIEPVICGDTLTFTVKFTPVCDALINFCVEAERSGFMDYQSNITTIFDLFGFRRDIFDRLNNEEKYLQTMNDAQTSTKLTLLDYVKGDKVVDVGSGGGVMLDMLEKKYPEKTIIGTDISANVIETLNHKIHEENHKYSVMEHNFVDGPLPMKVDTIIFSSILHEVFSYTSYEGVRFNIESVKTALKNAKASLNEGGVILIRDGVLTDSDKVVNVKFLDTDGVTFCKNYMKDFKGLTNLRSSDVWDEDKVKLNGDTLQADINFVREALYTYTWGTESYAMEKEEQFGYFTLKEYKNFLEGLGLSIEYSSELLEKGYPDHLGDKVSLIDFNWTDIPSNCIIVAKN